jgi:hypothetical protein
LPAYGGNLIESAIERVIVAGTEVIHFCACVVLFAVVEEAFPDRVLQRVNAAAVGVVSEDVAILRRVRRTDTI